MPLKILCAAETGDSHHLRHVELLAKAGVEVHLLDHALEATATPAATHAGWPKSGRRTLRRLLGRRFGDAIADRLLIRQLRAAWRRSGAQLCHVHWVDERLLAAARAGLHPLVVTAYGSDMNATQAPGYDPELLGQVKRGLARTDMFIADSTDMMTIADQLAGRKLPSLLLPIGVDSDLFKPGYKDEARAWRTELGIPAGAKVVLSPRVMRANYRQVELVRAFARAVHDHGLDGYMVLKAYASHADYVDMVRAAAAQAGVADRIRIIDEVAYERLPVLYAMADVAVNFPLLDAFPVTFLEAGACALPILTQHREAYDTSEMAPYLNFMDSEDEAAIGAQIAALCADPAAREKARAGRDYIAANLDETAFVRRLLGAYDAVLKRKAA